MVHCSQLNKIKKNKIYKIVKVVGIVLISTALAFFIGFLLLKFTPYNSLKKFLNNRKYSTRVYDCNYDLIQILPLDEGLHREYIPLEEMPQPVIDAFIIAEDKRFYSHSGVDISAIFRAFFQNAKNKYTVSGASTITMQLVRIINPKDNRNLLVKILEGIDATRLELRLSKEEILELYLNNVPFGFNTEGVASAARTFYGKSIFELTEDQIKTLAVIPRRPESYNPLTNPENCAKCTSAVFNIPLERTMNAVADAKEYEYKKQMPHYISYLEDKNIGFYKKDDLVLAADLRVQKIGEELLAQYLNVYSRNRISNGAILVINTQTGEIISWIGSGDFYNNRDKGQVDGVLATNQPGSSMKPFLYGLALDRGYSPNSILPDIPTDFGFEELYIPQNFNNKFNGPIRLRIALASSLNVPAVYLLNNLGIKNYNDKLCSIGFNSLKNANPGLGIALGNAEVSLFELVQGFSIFPRDGIFKELTPMLQSSDENSSIFKILNKKTEKYNSVSNHKEKEAFSKDTARLICNILSDQSSRVLGFRNTKAFTTPFPSMFKTGTANQYQNITALAATPLYTIGVWMGNFDGETVQGKTGSSIPATIAKTILEAIQFEQVNFKTPSQWKIQRICSLSGMAAGPNCPNSVNEYVRSSEMQKCTWHTESGLEYPPIYNNWLSLKNRQGKINDDYTPLKILSPKNNSVFFYDNNLGNKQNLFVEITGTKNENIIVTLKNMTSGTIQQMNINNQFKFTIPIEKGDFELTLKSENTGEISKINYTVQ